MKNEIKEKHQLDDPNFSRVFIDYKNDKVKFEKVGNENLFICCLSTVFEFMLFTSSGRLILILSTLIIFLPLDYGLENLSLIPKSLVSLILLIDWIIIPSVIFPIIIMSNKNLVKKLPYIEVSFAQVLYNITFTKEQVIDDKIEIPLFRNILLSYVAEEEFSKYLDRVEIIEHPFNKRVKVKGKFINRPQDKLWKAIFYFSKSPSIGELKVQFK